LDCRRFWLAGAGPSGVFSIASGSVFVSVFGTAEQASAGTDRLKAN